MDAGNPPTPRQRQATGVFFTPPAVVRYLVQHTLDPLWATRLDDQPLRILEPACGDGGFLAEVFRYLRQRRLQECLQQTARRGAFEPNGISRDAEGQWQLSAGEQRRLLLSSCFGLDIDPEFVVATRRTLAGLATDQPAPLVELQQSLQANIRCGDALLGACPPELDQAPGHDLASCHGPAATECVGHGTSDWLGTVPVSAGFDAVIGNPPYINIRRLTQTRSAEVKRYLRTHYQCAQGAYDLYVLFIELAFRLLRTGGVCGLIVPNKLAGLTYATACRAMLSERTTIRRIVDLSRWRVFPDAGVYPYILIWQKQSPAIGHEVAVSQAASDEELTADRGQWHVRQSSLSAVGGWQLHGTLDVEARVATMPLRSVARLHSGTTGFQATALARELFSESADTAPDPGAECFRFVVSGNLDRYRIDWGQARFMKRTWHRPLLARHSHVLTDAKRRLFAGSKIVVAGMVQRIEAAWDPGGLALGVQVYAVADLQEDYRYLLGLLNSKLLTYLFRTRFRAKQLAGGFLAINKGQLEQLPIRTVSEEDHSAMQDRSQLANCVDQLERLVGDASRDCAGCGETETRILAWDRQIDRLVYRLYRLTPDEIAQIESEITCSR